MKNNNFCKKLFIFFLCFFLTCNGIFYAVERTGGNNTGSTPGTTEGAPKGASKGASKGSPEGAPEGAPEGNGGEGKSQGENEGQNPPPQNYPVNSALGAINVAKTGGYLGGVSSEALKAGIEACGDSPENADAKSLMQNELDSRNTKNAEYNAIAAENAAAEAVKEYVADAQKLDSLQKEAAALYADISKMNYEYKKNGIVSDTYLKTVESYMEICQQIPAQESKVQESRTNVEQKTSEMRDAYTNLAAAYNAAGDPVRLATGDYLASYVDFQAVDEITHFKVIRNLCNSGYIESFGLNWTCSLDSRIVLCKSYDYSKLLENVEKSISIANNSKKVLENYKNTYPSYKNEEIEKDYESIKNKLNEMNNLKTLLEDYVEKNKLVEVLNHLVNYGRFKSHSSIFGSYNMLIFLDEEGVARFFVNKGNGKWVGVDDFTKSKMEIISRPVFDISFDYGYIVKFDDGRESYYSVSGVHIKDVDRNGNVTTYSTGKSNRIEKINLCTGETISVSRNEVGQITKISGPVSGTTSYSYTSFTLNSVVDNDGVKVAYQYDNDGYLTKILKADNSFVQINYKSIPETKKKVVSSVIDENSNKEYFDYFPSENKVVYTNGEGQKEIYIYNEAGNTIYKKDAAGVETEFKNYPSGMIKSLKENGDTKNYAYDSKLRLSTISYSNGGTEKFSYNKFSEITKHEDCDGFYNSYVYDEKGNLTEVYFCGNLQSSMKYTKTGLVSVVQERGKKYLYSYNSYGQLVSKTTQIENNNIVEKWTYNNFGKLASYDDGYGNKITYSYGPNYMEEVSKNNKIQHYYDLRNREIKTIETDLLTGEVYEKIIHRDGCGNIERIYLNGVLFGEYQYTSDGKIKKSSLYNQMDERDYVKEKNCVIIENNFGSHGFVCETEKSLSINGEVVESSKIQTNNYQLLPNGYMVSVYNFSNTLPEQYVYDSKKRLVSKKDLEGYEKKYTYSKAGRIYQIEDSNNNKWKYYYNEDGSFFIVQTNENGISAKAYYDEYGRKIKTEDFEGNVCRWDYDITGNLISENKVDREICYGYDKKNRLVSKTTFDNQGKIFESIEFSYDDEINKKTIRINNILDSENYYDCWGRLVKKTTQKGSEKYKYDILGNLVEKIDFDGNKCFFEYSPEGNKIYESNSNGDVWEWNYDLNNNLIKRIYNGKTEYAAKYDDCGRLQETANEYGAKTSYYYNYMGQPEKITRHDTGTVKTHISGNKITKTVGKSQYEYYIGIYGNIEKEIWPSGEEIIYKYDNNGRLIHKKSTTGHEENIYYDDKNRQKTSEYSNGQYKSTKSNINNQICAAENEDCHLLFEYDILGRLSKVTNKEISMDISYYYDSLGNCCRKKCDSFDVNYSYSKSGLLEKLCEKKSGVEIKFVYDEFGRETRCLYNNGLIVEYHYEKNGNKIASITKDSRNKIFSAEIILYDDFNRISTICDEKGRCKSFVYDERGRITTVFYPFTEELWNIKKNEAIDCGIYIKEDFNSKTNTQISDKEYSKLKEIINNLNISSYIKPSFGQNRFWEKYEYYDQGCIKSIENCFGKLVYDYDSLGRLIGKHGGNSEIGFIYKWTDDGKLSVVSGKNYKYEFEYGVSGKPISILFEDYLEKNKKIIEYKYDCLERIVFETINGQSRYAYVYDGFSSQVLCKMPVDINNLFWGNQNNLITENSNSEYRKLNEIEENYTSGNTVRILDNQYNYYDEYRQFVENSFENEDFRHMTNYGAEQNFDNRSIFFYNAYGIPVCSIYYDLYSENGCEIEYITTDFQKNISKIFDRNNNCLYENFYDIWGVSLKTEYSKNLFYSKNFALNLQNTQLYNADNRIYFPNIQTFLSVDLARDSGNWFSYCPTDPVNYHDSSGFAKKSSSKSEDAKYTAAISDFITFSSEDQKHLGESKGIPRVYDCADTSAAVDHLAAQEAGISGYSGMAEKFGTAHDKGETYNAKWTTSSSSYYNSSDKSEDVVKTSTGRGDLTNPNIVSPGTVLVFKPDTDNANPRKRTNTGHTITLLARDFDENGNVVGVVYIEGHFNEATAAEVGYMYVDGTPSNASKNLYNFDAWRGVYSGTYEIDGKKKAPEKKCGK